MVLLSIAGCAKKAFTGQPSFSRRILFVGTTTQSRSSCSLRGELQFLVPCLSCPHCSTASPGVKVFLTFFSANCHLDSLGRFAAESMFLDIQRPNHSLTTVLDYFLKPNGVLGFLLLLERQLMSHVALSFISGLFQLPHSIVYIGVVNPVLYCFH